MIYLDNAPPSLAVILVLTGMAVAQAPLVWWNWHPESTPRRLRESPYWGTGLNGYLAAGGTAAALIVWPLVLFGWGMYLNSRAHEPIFVGMAWTGAVIFGLALIPSLSVMLFGRPFFLIPPQFRTGQQKSSRNSSWPDG